MKNISPFQLVLLAVSGLVLVVGVIMFAFARSSSSAESGTVVVWGTLPETDFNQVKNYLSEVKKIKQTVEYRFIESSSFDNTLTTALAEGIGPDLVMITNERLLRHQNKLLQITYEFYPERLFKDTFVEAGEIFTDEVGMYAFPFLVDPIVMYWNRSLFTEAGQSQPPRFWDALLTMVPDLTKRDADLVLEKSAVALGAYNNVNHAKEVLTTLFMQAGNDIYVYGEVDTAGNPYRTVFDDTLGFSIAPAQAATNFYTQFSNPSRSVYTWNRSLTNSLDAFIAGDVAMYFGFASEFQTIRQKNPNLNFDVAVVPQSRSGRSVTYGNVLALAIPKNTPNVTPAYALIQSLTEADTIEIITDHLFLPPVRRDLLAENPGNAFMQTFHESALLANNVYDFNPEETDTIFGRMVESVVSGSQSTSEAVTRANEELQLLINAR